MVVVVGRNTHTKKAATCDRPSVQGCQRHRENDTIHTHGPLIYINKHIAAAEMQTMTPTLTSHWPLAVDCPWNNMFHAC